MRRTERQTAILLALLLKRSGQKRARISSLTIRNLSNRVNLRTAFLMRLTEELDDLGILFVEIERGYGLIPFSSLDGAPAITAKKYLPDILAQLKSNKIDFDLLLDEVDEEEGLDEGEEE